MQAHDLIRRSECGAVQPGDKIFRLLSSPFEDWAVITFCLLRGSQLTPHTSHLIKPLAYDNDIFSFIGTCCFAQVVQSNVSLELTNNVRWIVESSPPLRERERERERL